MALNVGNLVATLSLDKKGFDTGIQDAAKKTEGFAGGFSDKLSSLSPSIATMGEKVKGATSGIASKLSSLSPSIAAVGDKFKGVTAGISSGLSSLAAPIGAAKDKLIGLATGFASKMKTLAVPIAAVGAAIASLGTAAVLAADNINKAYNAIRVGTGATGEDLEALKSDFDAVFGTIPAGAGEVGTAIADLNTRLGLTGKPLQNMATRFLELSRITGTDVASNIKEVTRLFGNWNVAAEEQTGMLDYLFKVSQSTGIGVDRLSTLTTQYGSTLRGLGFDLKGSVAVLGKFEKGGVNIEAALAGMKMGLGNLAGKGITDPVEALDELARQVREAGTEIEAVSIAAEVFGARGAAEMAAAIRSGNLDLGDFVTMLDTSEETVLTAADASMSLGDRMAILQHKAEKALEPVGNLLIGAFEDAIPFLEGAGDHLADIGQGIADWAVQAQVAAAPFVASFQGRMVPVIDFLQEKLAYLFDWYEENSPIFIAAWENIGAAIQWVVETVIVPIIEWAWPYIETIISGVLDMLLSTVKLFTALLAGDWEAAGEALTEIAKGAMQALVGVISMGWDAIATGIEFVGQGILGFVYGLWKNIVQWTEDSLNKMIDLINGFIEAANSVTEKVGISLPKLGRIHLQADKIEIPKLKIQRWSETSFSKEIDEFLKKDEEEEEEEEEDIDKEFEDEPEREPAPALPKSQLPVAPKPEIPATPPAAAIPPVENPEISVDVPEIPETETPTIPAPSVSVPALDTPLPVSVTNWDQMVARIPVQEPGEPAAGREVEVIPVDIPEVSESEIPVVEPPAVVTPAPELPDLPDLPESEIPPIPPTSVEIPETEPPTIPDLPEPGVPESSPAPTPAFSLPIPVTVINWPAALRPVQAAPPAADERVEPVEEEEDIDKEFEKESEPEPAPTLPKSSLPVAPKPETPVAVVDVPEIPETETPTIPAPSVSVPALDTPLPVSVTNWDQMVARIPVQEPGEPAAGREVEVIPVDIPEVSESEIPVVEPPAVVTPAPELPDLPDLPESEIPPIPPTSVEIPETEPPTIPDLPEPGVPESSPAPTPAFSLPIPVTVINWPAALRPVQAAPPAADERVEPVEEEEDIDKEFEKESEPEPAPTLPKSSLPVAPKPETPVAVVDVPEIPETETPTIPAPSVSVPALDTPLPVSVTNWDQMVARSDVQEPKTPNSPDLPAVNVPVVEVPSAEVLVPGNEPSTPTEPPGLEAPALQEPDVPDPLPTLTIVWPDLLATLPEPKVSEPVVDAPDVVVPAVGVSVQEIPDIPEPTVPELSSRPIPPAFDLPIPVTVINWPDTLKPVPAVPLTEEERVTPADKEPDVDEEFVDLPEPTIVWPDLPKIQIPKIQIPDIVAAAMPPDPDAGALARILGLIGGGETRVVVELDGYAIGETLFRTWNRRTGGALNG